MERSIEHQFICTQSPEKVWAQLTESDLLAAWLMPNDFKAETGHQFQFKTKPKTKFSFDGTVYGKVLEVCKNEKLVYSWVGGSSKEHPSLDSVVTWTLKPREQGTLLTLKHSGFKGWKNSLPYVVMNLGWQKIGNRLLSRLKNH